MLQTNCICFKLKGRWLFCQLYKRYFWLDWTFHCFDGLLRCTNSYPFFTSTIVEPIAHDECCSCWVYLRLIWRCEAVTWMRNIYHAGVDRRVRTVVVYWFYQGLFEVASWLSFYRLALYGLFSVFLFTHLTLFFVLTWLNSIQTQYFRYFLSCVGVCRLAVIQSTPRSFLLLMVDRTW